jgi:cysteine desulfurase
VEKRSPINLNICIPGKVAEQLFTFFPHIALSTGSACTSGTIEKSHVLSALKVSNEQIDGSFRISFGRQSSKNDIKELLENLKKI